MSWNAKIIELISLHSEGDKEAYQKFFKSALSKFGIKSPTELDDEKKKEFFNYIDKNYDAKNESLYDYRNVGDHYGGGLSTSGGINTSMFKDKKTGRYYVYINTKKQKGYFDMPKNIKSRSQADDFHMKLQDMIKAGKRLKLTKESVIKENPAVIATAARMAITNAQGKKVSVNTARQKDYREKDPSAHKKAKSIFDKIKDKLKKVKGKKSSSSSKGQKLKTTNDPKIAKSDAQKYSDLYGGGAKVESTASYAASLEKIARDRQLRQISNKDKQLLMKLAKMMKNANESVEEAVTAYGQSKTWEWSDSRISDEISKIFRLAGIKVIEHRPFKKPYRSGDSELYGAFITAKDQYGEKTVLPIEVNKKGIVTYAGGPKGWHKMEKLGALNMSHAKPKDFLRFKGVGQPVAFLKAFKKMPGFGQDVIKRK
tara:strand:+ start:243 stop:1523 length:1281 start_codon:yes stop_codon:yes gene_type:complete